MRKYINYGNNIELIILEESDSLLDNLDDFHDANNIVSYDVDKKIFKNIKVNGKLIIKSDVYDINKFINNIKKMNPIKNADELSHFISKLIRKDRIDLYLNDTSKKEDIETDI